MRREEVSSTRLSWLRTALLSVLVLLGLWWTLRPSSSDAVTDVARTLSAVLSLPKHEAETSLSAHVAERVSVSVAGIQRELTRAELVRSVGEYLTTNGPKQIALNNVDVHVTGTRARLEALVVASESQHGDLHAEERPIIAEFDLNGSWRLRALNLGAAAKHIPEARP